MKSIRGRSISQSGQSCFHRIHRSCGCGGNCNREHYCLIPFTNVIPADAVLFRQADSFLIPSIGSSEISELLAETTCSVLPTSMRFLRTEATTMRPALQSTRFVATCIDSYVHTYGICEHAGPLDRSENATVVSWARARATTMTMNLTTPYSVSHGMKNAIVAGGRTQTPYTEYSTANNRKMVLSTPSVRRQDEDFAPEYARVSSR